MEAQEMLGYKNWIVAGDVTNTEKYAFRILHSLKNAGFNVFGVNPRSSSPEVYKSIKDVPCKVDVIDLCINPIAGLQIIKEAAELKIDKVLIQPGAESLDIFDYCRKNGIIFIEGCALVELSYYKR